jgi:hypothetical protein
MSKENEFLIFVVEYYRNKKNLSGKYGLSFKRR